MGLQINSHNSKSDTEVCANNINLCESVLKVEKINISSDFSNKNGVIGNVASLVGIEARVGGGGETSAITAKHQLDQLNTMREALFSQDGWGCQHVNQDTNWEVPSSPEPSNKDASGPPMWKPTINNGTDLWESNLRNGGQPTVAQQTQKPSWGHTPSSNLGGTWGEDDDGTDSSNVWSGATNNATSSATAVGVGNVGTAGVATGVVPASGPQWGQGVVGVGMGATNSGGGNGAVGMPGVPTGGSSNTANVNTAGSSSGNTSSVGTAGNGWGDPREIRSGVPLGGGPLDMRNVDPRDAIRGSSSGDPRDLRMLDPRDPIRGDPRGISGRLNGTSEMWGHHQQIAHNQMPTMNKMVGQVVGGSGPNVAVSASGVNTIGGPGAVSSGVSSNVAAQWGAQQNSVGPKDISKQVTGWEEPSPPPQRRNLPNYDDGTSLWSQQARVPGGGSHWKEMSDPMNRSHLMRGQNPAAGIVIPGNGNVQISGNPNNPMASVVGPQCRLTNAVGPGVVTGQHKLDAGMWVGRNQTSSWNDETNNLPGVTTANAGWVDDKSNAGISQIGNNTNSWNDTPTSGWSNKSNKLPPANAGGSWSSASNNVGGGPSDSNDLNADWSTHGGLGKAPQQKLAAINVGGLSVDIIKQSKQYRMLVEAGFKKEDVERALLSANMSFEEAADLLRNNTSIDGWRRLDDTLGSYADHANSTGGGGGGGFPGRYSSFPPNNLLNNMGGNAVTGSSNNPNLAAIQMQKYLNQGPHSVTIGPQAVASSFGQAATGNTAASVNMNSNTTTQQLRVLVQQIQLAVHSGFLSSQILNQPLSQTTLSLVNQLLSTIKHLQTAQQSLSRGTNANPLAINVAIAKYKQQIQNLQNQINAQQAIYIKQQQQQQQQPHLQPNPQQPQQPQHTASHLNSTPSNEYLRGHDAIGALQGNFSELNLNKQPSGYQGAANQQSRLNQWKLPVLEKDVTADSTDFSRAPGATKQGLSTTNANNMGPLGLPNDGTWSTGRNIGDGWPDSATDNENKDWSVAQQNTATTYTDLVQEFEPGKPWKGSQIKSIEDDPSITPGSVVRSPLSINPTPKDADIFTNTGKNSPTDLPTLSLSSSTWSFNPNQNFPSWSDNSTQQCATSELWASSLNKTSRGPPPGLSTNKAASAVSVNVSTNPSTITGSANGWLAAGRSVPNSNTTWSGVNSSWSSNWLLIKNLTTQIDGSTLRTLCMQHGPLLNFHLYLNQGIALCKYATREEASKAQMTLNNCVLGNTTIYAESPNENEVQNILQHLPQTPTPAGNAVISTSSGVASGNSNGGGGNGNGGTNIPTCSISSNNGSNTTTSGSSGPSISGTNSNNNGNSASSNTNSSINGANNTSNAGAGVGNGSTNSGSNIGKNTSNCGNNSAGTGQPIVSSVSTNVAGVGIGNNSAWRQTTQNQTQQQQNQTRPTGRETDYDYISQFVCSIVDD